MKDWVSLVSKRLLWVVGIGICAVNHLGVTWVPYFQPDGLHPGDRDLLSCSTVPMFTPGRAAVIQMQQRADSDCGHQCNTYATDLAVTQMFNPIVTTASTKQQLLPVPLIVGCSICIRGQYLFYGVSDKTHGSEQFSAPFDITLRSSKTQDAFWVLWLDAVPFWAL